MLSYPDIVQAIHETETLVHCAEFGSQAHDVLCDDAKVLRRLLGMTEEHQRAVAAWPGLARRKLSALVMNAGPAETGPAVA